MLLARQLTLEEALAGQGKATGGGGGVKRRRGDDEEGDDEDEDGRVLKKTPTEIADYRLDGEFVGGADDSEHEDTWEAAASDFLDVFTQHRYAADFLEPVDCDALGLDDYHDYVQTPMDLGTIRKRLHADQYTSVDDFLADIALVFDNACAYNGPANPVHVRAATLRSVLKRRQDAFRARVAALKKPMLSPMKRQETVRIEVEEEEEEEEEDDEEEEDEDGFSSDEPSNVDRDALVDYRCERYRRVATGKDDVSFSVCAETATGGFRKANQDAFCIDHRVDDVFITGVFDGHGDLGETAATMCARLLPTSVIAAYKSGKTPKEALRMAFAETNDALLAVAEQLYKATHLRTVNKTMDFGTTAVVLMLVGRTAYVANVGDSRCIRVFSNGTHTQVTTDHTPTIHEAECARIKRQGGQLVRAGPELRVVPGDMDIESARRNRLTLNMSRALGHRLLAHAGISAVPELFVVDGVAAGESFVLASDGVWDVMENESVAKRVTTTEDSHEACMGLIRECDHRWNKRRNARGDNITVALVKFT